MELEWSLKYTPEQVCEGFPWRTGWRNFLPPAGSPGMKMSEQRCCFFPFCFLLASTSLLSLLMPSFAGIKIQLSAAFQCRLKTSDHLSSQVKIGTPGAHRFNNLVTTGAQTLQHADATDNLPSLHLVSQLSQSRLIYCQF